MRHGDNQAGVGPRQTDPPSLTVTRPAGREPAFTVPGVGEFAVPIMPANDLDATPSFYERLGFTNAGSASTEVRAGAGSRCRSKIWHPIQGDF